MEEVIGSIPIRSTIEPASLQKNPPHKVLVSGSKFLNQFPHSAQTLLSCPIFRAGEGILLPGHAFNPNCQTPIVSDLCGNGWMRKEAVGRKAGIGREGARRLPGSQALAHAVQMAFN
jgi:hypothetical protein